MRGSENKAARKVLEDDDGDDDDVEKAGRRGSSERASERASVRGRLERGRGRYAEGLTVERNVVAEVRVLVEHLAATVAGAVALVVARKEVDDAVLDVLGDLGERVHVARARRALAAGRKARGRREGRRRKGGTRRREGEVKSRRTRKR